MKLWAYDPTHTKSYLEFCRRAFAVTASGGTVQLSWASDPLDAEGWRAEFVQTLHFRISLKGGFNPDTAGRRFDPDYQRALLQDYWDLRNRVDNRIRVYSWRTDIFRKRFDHYLSSRND